MTTAQDVTRLPKWAQRRIEILERRTAELEALFAIGPEDSDTFVDPYSRPRTPCGMGTQIAFVLDPDDPRGDELTVRLVREAHVSPYLGVTSRYGHLLVTPQASNLVRVRTSTDHGLY